MAQIDLIRLVDPPAVNIGLDPTNPDDMQLLKQIIPLIMHKADYADMSTDYHTLRKACKNIVTICDAILHEEDKKTPDCWRNLE